MAVPTVPESGSGAITTWQASFDMSQDLPLNTRKRPKKHKIDGNTVTDGSNFIEAGDDDEEDDEELVDEQSPFLKNDFSRSSDANRVAKDVKPFFITEKYRPILLAASLDKDEIVVVERPTQIGSSSSAAFDLPKITF